MNEEMPLVKKYINDLPDELIEMIFEKFCESENIKKIIQTVSLVCKDWNRLLMGLLDRIIYKILDRCTGKNINYIDKYEVYTFWRKIIIRNLCEISKKVKDWEKVKQIRCCLMYDNRCYIPYNRVNNKVLWKCDLLVKNLIWGKYKMIGIANEIKVSNGVYLFLYKNVTINQRNIVIETGWGYPYKELSKIFKCYDSFVNLLEIDLKTELSIEITD